MIEPIAPLRSQVCRYLVKDFGTSKSPKSTRQRGSHYAPAALRPCRFATPSHARRWLRSTPTNGLTACRMRLHMPFAGLGPIGPKPLRPYARAYAYRGLRALASLSMARSECSQRRGTWFPFSMVFMPSEIQT